MDSTQAAAKCGMCKAIHASRIKNQVVSELQGGWQQQRVETLLVKQCDVLHDPMHVQMFQFICQFI